MKTPTPPIVLVLLGICIGTCFGWLISFGRPGPVPVVIEHPNPPAPAPTPVVAVASPPASVPVSPVIVGDWRLAADEIREYTADAKEFDSILDAKIAAYPDNPTAKVALLFAAVQWADRVEDSSAMNRKTLALKEFHQYWKRDLLWKIESGSV